MQYSVEYAGYAEYAEYAECAECAGYAKYAEGLTADGACHCPVGSIMAIFMAREDPEPIFQGLFMVVNEKPSGLKGERLLHRAKQQLYILKH